jgi:hypothetical protein
VVFAVFKALCGEGVYSCPFSLLPLQCSLQALAMCGQSKEEDGGEEDTNDLPSVAKKKVAAAATSVSSTESFHTAGLALQLEVSMVAAVRIPSRKVGEEC